MLGAACLVSLAAMRFGVGLVTALIPRQLNLTLQRKISHAVMTLPVPGTRNGFFGPRDVKILSQSLNKYTAIALGPGISVCPSTSKFIRNMILACSLPIVIDADALNLISTQKNLLKTFRIPPILTPHPGEFFRLSGLKPVTDRARCEVAKSWAEDHNVILVLKGPHTIVASPNGRIYRNPSGNAGMAKAGMGDVLTGMIGGLLAQGVNGFEAAKTAVYWHGVAGDNLLKHMNIYAFTAEDLINELGEIKCF